MTSNLEYGHGNWSKVSGFQIIVMVNYTESVACVDDYWITIVKTVIQVVIMVTYVYKHDLMNAYIDIIEKETSSHALKTLTAVNDPKICIIMDPYIYLCLSYHINEPGCI